MLFSHCRLQLLYRELAGLSREMKEKYVGREDDKLKALLGETKGLLGATESRTVLRKWGIISRHEAAPFCAGVRFGIFE